MSEAIKPKCCATVTPAGAWRSYQCSKNASMEHEGKHYCKTHHPPTALAKRDARTAQINAEIAERCRRDQERRDAAAENKRRADCYGQLVARVEELGEALGEYMSAFGQALEAHGIQFAQQQVIADEMARAALSKSLPTVAEVK